MKLENSIHIFFDLDNTIVQHSNAQREAILAFGKELMINVEDQELVDLWFSISNKHYIPYFAGLIDLETQRKNRISDLLECFGLSIQSSEHLQYFEKYHDSYMINCKVYDDVTEALSLLNRFPKSIITNGLQNIQRKKLKINAIDDQFEHIVSSDLPRCRPKPNSEIFEYALEITKTSSSDAYFIGDLIDIDVLPTQELGMNAIWLNRSGSKMGKGTFLEIESLLELEPLITDHVNS